MLAVIEVADQAGARLWLDGGRGVDALLGGQTREHGDLDVAVEAHQLDSLLNGLHRAGFARLGEQGATAWNFLVAHPGGAVVDLQVIERDADGNGVLSPAEVGHAYPAQSLTGRGRLGEREVDCVSADWVVRFHDAYPGDGPDRADVRALCARFGLEVPEQYR